MGWFKKSNQQNDVAKELSRYYKKSLSVISRIAKFLRKQPGELYIDFAYLSPKYKDYEPVIIPGFQVAFVIYTSGHTFIELHDYIEEGEERGYRFFFFRAVTANDFGDIVHIIKGDTFKEVVDKVAEYMKDFYPGKELEGIEITPSVCEVRWDEDN